MFISLSCYNGYMVLFKEYRGLRKELYVLFISRIVTSMGSMIWVMMTILLTQKLGLSVNESANWMVVFAIVCIPIQYLGGYLSDHFSKKILLFIQILLN